MQRVEAQPAFVLHARPYRETSLLLECFSRDHGRVGLVARGIRREKSHLPRGVLQPLQPLLLGWAGRGELATLTAAETASVPLALSGDALLAGIYLNELVLRLTGRNDPHPDVFDAYVGCLTRLAAVGSVAWSLRRFERDFLAELGYALVLDREADTGAPLAAAADYAYVFDSGPVPWRGDVGVLKISGSALLALAHDEMPDALRLGELRRLTRAAIRHQLGGGILNAWMLTTPDVADRRV